MIQSERQPHKPRMTKSQGYARKCARIYGMELAHYHPELADLYISGAPATHLARSYRRELEFLFPQSSDTSHLSIVMNALRSQIEPEEMKNLGKEHMMSCGLNARDFKRGLHGLTDSEKSTARYKGVVSQMEQHKGIFSFDAEKRHAIGIHRIQLQGKEPISEEEEAYLGELLQNPAFLHQGGRNKGRTNISAIAEAIKDRFGLQRTNLAIRIIACNYRKKLALGY